MSTNTTTTRSPAVALEHAFARVIRAIEDLNTFEELYDRASETAEEEFEAVTNAAGELTRSLGDGMPPEQAKAAQALEDAMRRFQAHATAAETNARRHLDLAMGRAGDALGRYARARTRFLQWAAELNAELHAGAANEVAWRDRLVKGGLRPWDDVRIEIPWEPAPERISFA